MAPFFFCLFSLLLAPSDAAWAYSRQSHESNRISALNGAAKLIAKEGKSGVASHHLEPSCLLLLRPELLLLLLFGLSQTEHT
jgi:hypothetical protein